jgi:hypothetical protein
MSYVAFVTAQDAGSRQLTQLYEQLPARQQQAIQLRNFHEAKQQFGAGCPKWLRGFPTLATVEPSPTVWEGSRAVDILRAWVEQARRAPAFGAPHNNTHRPPAATAAHPPPVAEAEAPGSLLGRGSSVVSDELYQSRMESKNNVAGPATQSTNKIKQSDIDQYNSRRT